jgi:hypothetical protein
VSCRCSTTTWHLDQESNLGKPGQSRPHCHCAIQVQAKHLGSPGVNRTLSCSRIRRVLSHFATGLQNGSRGWNRTSGLLVNGQALLPTELPVNLGVRGRNRTCLISFRKRAPNPIDHADTPLLMQILVDDRGIEPRLCGCRPHVLPLSLATQGTKTKMATSYR